ncbi:GAF and ANTAR domain-containing protein [Nocardia sp. NPDC050378]|uniref:GAF and ANTAR domain-containing protein n=1 Tax=Nocardia sp. NPDC050378 TaxID=3155400 RepID=UPI003407440C
MDIRRSEGSVEGAFRDRPGDPYNPDRHDVGSDGSLFGGVGALCAAAVRLTGADGAALALLGRTSQARELVYATDATAQQLDELQFVIGEGPCIDTYRRGERQLWPDLTATPATTRWPVFTAELLTLGVRALFAFPVPSGDATVGVLELYRMSSGRLSAVEQDSGLACAAAVGHMIGADLDRLADTEALAATDPAGEEFSRAVIFNAAGMVAVQLAVSADEALARLRAYCYANGRSISAVAADIVARRLSLHDQRDSSEGQGR